MCSQKHLPLLAGWGKKKKLSSPASDCCALFYVAHLSESWSLLPHSPLSPHIVHCRSSGDVDDISFPLICPSLQLLFLINGLRLFSGSWFHALSMLLSHRPAIAFLQPSLPVGQAEAAFASGMYKNQLQELAQRSCANLPAYSCIREGPDHAPRFKATVNFNGEIFESPHFCNTLRQAEHAAAEVALNTLSRGGPSQSLAAKILDETSVCKNLLQETAQRVGVSLPAYTTIKLGPGHLPVFKCLVEVAGRVFAGEPAKTKKQAEKNAAMTAWSVIKHWTHPPTITSVDDSNDGDRSNTTNALTVYRRRADNNLQMQSSQRRCGGHSKCRVVNVRGKNRLSREGSLSGQVNYGVSSFPSSPSSDAGFEDQRVLFGGQSSNDCRTEGLRNMGGYQRSPSWFDYEATQPEAFLKSRANGGNAGRILPLPWHHQPQQHRLSRLSLQSHSDRFELRRPLMEDINKECDDDWLSGDMTTPLSQSQQHSQASSPSDRGYDGLPRRAMFQSQSERFELKPSLLDELYYKDQEDWWLRGELAQPVAMLEQARSVLQGEQDGGSIVFYDGTVASPYGRKESSDIGTVGNVFSSAFRDPNIIPKGGFHEVVSQEVPYGGYAKGNRFQAPFAGFQNAISPNTSYKDVDRGYSEYTGDLGPSHSAINYNRDGASSSYTKFSSVDTLQSYLNDDIVKSALSGYSNSLRSRQVVEKEIGPFSAEAWPQPSHMWASRPLGSHISTLHEGNSIAPPVKVRQMVAMCSAPPRCPPFEAPSTRYPSPRYMQEQNPPSTSKEAAACQLFSQLRI